MTSRPIVFFIVSTHLGGAERSLLDLMTSFRRVVPDTPLHVVSPKSQGPLIEQLQVLKIPVTTVPMPENLLETSRKDWIGFFRTLILQSPEIFRYLLALRSTFKKLNPFVVHTTGIKCHALTTFVVPFGVHVVWHIRDFLESRGVHFLLSTFSQISQPEIWANSKATAKTFSPSPKIKVLYNGIDTETFQPQVSHALRQRWNISEEYLLVGLCSVFARWKGQLEFVRLAGEAKKQGLKAKFILVGDAIYDTKSEGGYKEEVLNEIKKLELDKDVFLAGFQKDMPKIFSELDVLVHASVEPEPFGRVVAEAMSCQTPVLAANAGGVPEIVDHEIDGYLYPPGDIASLLKGLTRLVEDTPFRTELGRNGRNKILKNFALKDFDSHLKSLIKDWPLDLLNDQPNEGTNDGP